MLLIIVCSKSDDPQPVPNAQTGKMTQELTVNGITNAHIIYVLENYTNSSSFPLLLSFHCLTSNMEFNFNYTNCNQLAENENFIVVHPNGIDNRWTVNASNNPDIDFI